MTYRWLIVVFRSLNTARLPGTRSLSRKDYMENKNLAIQFINPGLWCDFLNICLKRFFSPRLDATSPRVSAQRELVDRLFDRLLDVKKK